MAAVANSWKSVILISKHANVNTYMIFCTLHRSWIHPGVQLCNPVVAEIHVPLCDRMWIDSTYSKWGWAGSDFFEQIPDIRKKSLTSNKTARYPVGICWPDIRPILNFQLILFKRVVNIYVLAYDDRGLQLFRLTMHEVCKNANDPTMLRDSRFRRLEWDFPIQAQPSLCERDIHTKQILKIKR